MSRTSISRIALVGIGCLLLVLDPAFGQPVALSGGTDGWISKSLPSAVLGGQGAIALLALFVIWLAGALAVDEVDGAPVRVVSALGPILAQSSFHAADARDEREITLKTAA